MWRGQVRPRSAEILLITVGSVLLVSFASSVVAAGTVPLDENDTTDASVGDGVGDAVDPTTPTTDTVESTTTAPTVGDITGGPTGPATDTIDGSVDTTTDAVGATITTTTDVLTAPPVSLTIVVTIADTSPDDRTSRASADPSGHPLGPTGVTARPAGQSAAATAADASAPPLAATQGAASGRDGPVDPGPLAAGATATTGMGAVAVGAMLGSGTRSPVRTLVGDRLDRLVRLLALLRYSRYDGSDPLDHEDRAALNDHVTAQPGTYLSAVSEALDIPTSTVRHHVKILEREGVLETATVRGRRRLFPAHTQQQALAAALADDATAAILTALARRGPCSGCELADAVDRCVATVSHHLSRLAADELVVRETDGRTTVNRLPADVQTALAREQEPREGDTVRVTAN